MCPRISFVIQQPLIAHISTSKPGLSFTANISSENISWRRVLTIDVKSIGQGLNCGEPIDLADLSSATETIGPDEFANNAQATLHMIAVDWVAYKSSSATVPSDDHSRSLERLLPLRDVESPQPFTHCLFLRWIIIVRIPAFQTSSKCTLIPCSGGPFSDKIFG